MKRAILILFLSVMLGCASYVIYEDYFAPVKAYSYNPGIKADSGSKTPESDASGDIELELAGVVRLKMNESNSWSTILKILVLVLVTYGGVKFINKKFE